MVSVIIPVYINGPEILDYLSDCIISLRGYDELVVQFDNNGEGFAKTVNRGVSKSNGDYIAIVNDDTIMLEGNLRDYCIPNTICRPTIDGVDSKFPFAVMSREVWNKVGGLDEDFGTGLYEDKLFLDIARSKGVELRKLKLRVWHKGSATLEKFDVKKLRERNWEIYKEKKKKLGIK